MGLSHFIHRLFILTLGIISKIPYILLKAAIEKIYPSFQQIANMVNLFLPKYFLEKFRKMAFFYEIIALLINSFY